MTRWMTFASLLLVITAGLAFAQEGEQETMEKPVVVMKTSLGDVVIELDAENAPVTVENFLRYVDEGFYDGTIFHRVIKGFMIQGGGFTEELEKKPTHDPIKNEAANGLRNDIGTIAMARTNVVDSATSQFFINTVNNGNLNFKSADPRGFGYCVFGRVIEGLDVVQAIESTPVTRRGIHQNMPATTVTILSVKRR